MSVNNISPGYHPKTRVKAWHPMSRVGLAEWVNKTFDSTTESYSATNDACPLFPHQHIIKDYLAPESPYRSLILYQGLGTGKTRASIAVAEVLSSHYKIVVMVPASLEGNYRDEILKCANDAYRSTGHWVFVAKPGSKTTASKKSGKVEYEAAEATALAQGVSAKTIRKNKGIWVRRDDGGSGSGSNNRARLEPEQQSQIGAQIDDMISARYTFVRYNGLNTRSAAELLARTEGFKDSVVIIDEVHNFISRVVNNSKIAPQVYRALASCETCKLLLLSGTPLINRPIELGKLCNLARGPLHMLNLSLDPASMNGKVDKVQARLGELGWVDMCEISDTEVMIVPLPLGFVWHGDKNKFLIKRSKDAPATHADMIVALQELLRQEFRVVTKGKGALVRKLLFPDKEKDFEDFFVDYTALAKARSGQQASPIKNPQLMARRLQGIISYYEAYDASQFPVLEDTEVVKVQMPTATFATYMSKRNDEVKKESMADKRASKKDSGDLASGVKKDLTGGNVYRCFSRALCNFMFPSEFKRPYPSSIREALKELDDLDADESTGNKDDDDEGDDAKGKKGGAPKKAQGDEKSVKKLAYATQLARVMEALESAGDKYLKGDGLRETSPKYYEMLQRIRESPGPTLVYSQFRAVEGLGVFSMMLKANGWAELDIKRNSGGEWELNMSEGDLRKPKFVAFTSDKDKNKVLLPLFNSEFHMLPGGLQEELKALRVKGNLHGEFVKVMLITQSGAEGISLKNVRQVHLMEPYWNEVRTKQVIGRAVRAGSHLALPVEERRVNVYLYLMTFTTNQKKDSLVASRDMGMTSDEFILDVAKRKSLLTDTLLGLMKSSAVDCVAHKRVHTGVKCLKVPKTFGTPQGFMYSYKGVGSDPGDNIVEQRIEAKKVVRKLREANMRNKDGSVRRMMYDIETGEMFPAEQVEKGVFEAVARVVTGENGAKQVVPVRRE